MTVMLDSPRPDNRHDRPTVASLLAPLRVRLPLLVAVVLSVVVSAAAYWEVRLFAASLTASLTENARTTAQAVADDLEVNEDPLTRPELHDLLHEFTWAFPSSRAILVVTMQGGQPAVVANTSTTEGADWLDVARRTIVGDQVITAEPVKSIHLVGVPVKRDGRVWGAAVVTYSLSSVDELWRQARFVVLWIVPTSVFLMTLLLELLTRRMVHVPIARIRQTMQRVRKGDLKARAVVMSEDEIGAVARGLNEMLGEMEGLHADLQDRVREATRELRARNEELVESYRRVFALREALARADQLAAIGHMAASVAHQVGTPLNLISGYVQMIHEEQGLDDRLTHRLTIVQEQIAKVTSIVRTLLDRAKPAKAKSRTDVERLVRRVVEIAGPRVEAQKVAVNVRHEGETFVTADAPQLELALLNLVANALDAMPDGGVIDVAVTGTDAERVRVDVRDTGTGIDPSVLPRIFEPWVTTKEPGRGTGLGLSITRDVVTGHGGTITVKSEPGAGSVFTVELPAAPPATTAGGDEADGENPDRR